jgi:hypothetical protein
MMSHVLHPALSTGNSRKYVLGMEGGNKFLFEYQVTAIGGSPTITFTAEGMPGPNDDPTVAGSWLVLSMVTPDATVAAAKASTPNVFVMTTVSKQYRYVTLGSASDPQEARFFTGFAINATANTNVTYTTSIHRVDV